MHKLFGTMVHQFYGQEAFPYYKSNLKSNVSRWIINYEIAKEPKSLVSFGTSVKTAHACALSILKIDNHINISFDMKKQTQLAPHKNKLT